MNTIKHGALKNPFNPLCSWACALLIHLCIKNTSLWKLFENSSCVHFCHFEMNCRDLCDTAEFWMLWTLKKTKEEKNMKWSFVPWWTQNDTATKCVFNFISSFLGGNLTFKRLCQKGTALAKETCFSSRKSCLKK